MMSLLQRIFLVLGATISGMVATGLGLAFLAAMTILQPRPGEEPGTAWGGVVVFLGCLVCGGILGALVGATVAIRRIAQFPDRNWSPFTWTGVAFGILIGIAVGLCGIGGGTFLHDLFAPFDGSWRSWLSTGVATTLVGTLGGVAANVLERAIRSRRGTGHQGSR